MQARVSPRDARTEETLADVAAYLRREPKEMQALLERAYASSIAERLAADGRFGGVQPRFHLAQNASHHPVHTAWQAGRSTLAPGDVPDTAEGAYADVLVNRNPAETNRTYAPGHEQWAYAMGPDEYDRR